MIHKIYKQKKVWGEWFQLDQSDINIFYENCQKIHDNLELISKKNTYFLDKGDFQIYKNKK